MKKKEWRANPAMWLIFGPLVLFTGGFALLCLFSPLWNQFASDKATPLHLAFIVLVGAPLFSWMTVGIFRPMQVRVVADETGLFLRDNDRKGSGVRLIESTVRWDEIRALYRKDSQHKYTIFLWTGEREILLPPFLQNGESLRVELEKRTGLSLETRLFPPGDESFLVQWDGARAFRHQIASASLGWLLWVLFVAGFWLLMARFVWPNTTPEMLLPLYFAIGTMAFGTLYGLGSTIWGISRLKSHRDEKWRFDWDAISREKAGQKTVLPLEALEKLENVRHRKLRASGAGTVLEWPKFSVYVVREEAFLRERLERANPESR